ncbi:hypothetical protein AcV7_001053 [Taiwanofungus camphoratus]|nr:hypothetical protein AcV7_001053 [Antrodia cinnamomea]
MTLDLLDQCETPWHLYRFDLESFFYVLVWFCASFDPTQNRIGFITSWQNDDLTNRCRQTSLSHAAVGVSGGDRACQPLLRAPHQRMGGQLAIPVLETSYDGRLL